LSNRYKLIILTIIGAAVIAVLLLPSLDWFSAAGWEDSKTSESSINAREEFTPAADPYMEYVQARVDEKPIVLEFYANY